MKALLKLAVAILLLVCLADLPYGFYEIVRFAACAAFAYPTFGALCLQPLPCSSNHSSRFLWAERYGMPLTSSWHLRSFISLSGP